MALQKCPHCGANVREDRTVCPACDSKLIPDAEDAHSGHTWDDDPRSPSDWGRGHEEEEEDRTSMPASARQRLAHDEEVPTSSGNHHAAPPEPPPPPPPARAAEPAPAPAPAPPRREKPAKASSASGVRPAPASTLRPPKKVPPQYQAPAPQPPPVGPAVPYPGYSYGPAAPPPPPEPRGIKAKLIRMLGGTPPGGVESGGYPQAVLPAGSQQVPPQPLAHPPYGAVPNPGYGYPSGAAPGYPGGVVPAPEVPSARPTGSPWSQPASQSQEDEADETRLPYGEEFEELKRPPFILQVLDAQGNWRYFTDIGPKGRKLGRAEVNSPTLATQHFGLGFWRNPSRPAVPDRLCVAPLTSTNGVFVKVNAPVPLASGNRFRVSDYLLEFRDADPTAEVEPAVSSEGERFVARDLAILGWIILIRPSGKDGHAFPVTSPTVLLGRAPRLEGEDNGPAQVIVLPDDRNLVSRTHARIDRHGHSFVLSNRSTSSGTFIQVSGAHALNSGDEFLAGDRRFRVEGRPPGV